MVSGVGDTHVCPSKRDFVHFEFELHVGVGTVPKRGLMRKHSNTSKRSSPSGLTCPKYGPIWT